MSMPTRASSSMCVSVPGGRVQMERRVEEAPAFGLAHENQDERRVLTPAAGAVDAIGHHEEAKQRDIYPPRHLPPRLVGRRLGSSERRVPR